MLHYASALFLIVVIAGVLAFGGLAGGSSVIAQILFFSSLTFLVFLLVVGFGRRT